MIPYILRNDYYYYGGNNTTRGVYFDWTMILILIGIAVSLWASFNVRSTFNKYSKTASVRGMNGCEVANQILLSKGIMNVRVASTQGDLTDHFDPRTNVVNLSETVYGKSSISAISVAAHECGHAMQHAEGYAPLKIRTAIVPIANFGNMLSWPLIIIGLMMGTGGRTILLIGIILFASVVAFQVITLPVEFNASRRGLQALRSNGLVTAEEDKKASKVLKAAALTYVAAAAVAALQLLRIILLTRRD
ncbi:MAG: zinc metallopeptidase [Lachnospiraceae bacterium]|nr:zinc metallopeptidase [Lachnospiraceae bacterium]